METRPMAIVETVGVRYLGWILANDVGMALYAAMDSEVRAVGRIVVCVEAEADVRIDADSRSRAIFPSPESPNRAGPMAANTSSALSGLPRPIPVVPTPANATAAVETSR